MTRNQKINLILTLLVSVGCKPKTTVKIHSDATTIQALFGVDTPCKIEGKYSNKLVTKENFGNSLALSDPKDSDEESDKPYAKFLLGQIKAAPSFPLNAINLSIDPKVERFGANKESRRFVVHFSVVIADASKVPLLNAVSINGQGQSSVAVVVSKNGGSFSSNLSDLKINMGDKADPRNLKMNLPSDQEISDWVERAYESVIGGENPKASESVELSTYGRQPATPIAVVRESGELTLGWQIKFIQVIDKKYAGSLFEALVVPNDQGPAEIKAWRSQSGIDGTARVRLGNGEDKFTLVPLKNMQEGGYLCNDVFVVQMPKDKAYVQNPKSEFAPAENSPGYEQVSAFAHAMSMWNFFMEKGANNWAGTQIVLDFPDSLYWRSEGPQYQNPDIVNYDGEGVSRPTIRMPAAMLDSSRYNDDGTQRDALHNLRVDSDAIAHELAHHFLYQYVGVINDYEHMAVVEGIPDIMVMTRYKNPCLAESICVPGNSICISSQCLRTADNNYVYGTDAYNSLGGPHKMSQIVSGLIWSIHVDHKIDLDYLGGLVINSMKFMQRTTSYKDFIKALLDAEKATNGKKYSCQIYESATKRGLNFLDPFDCKTY